jgi:hypothetical protein
MVNNTWIIYESLEDSHATFRWCWQVCDLDLGMVCPYPGIWGSTHSCGNIHNVGKIMFSWKIYQMIYMEKRKRENLKGKT